MWPVCFFKYCIRQFTFLRAFADIYLVEFLRDMILCYINVYSSLSQIIVIDYDRNIFVFLQPIL